MNVLEMKKYPVSDKKYLSKEIEYIEYITENQMKVSELKNTTLINSSMELFYRRMEGTGKNN